MAPVSIYITTTELGQNNGICQCLHAWEWAQLAPASPECTLSLVSLFYQQTMHYSIWTFCAGFRSSESVYGSIKSRFSFP